MEWISNNSEWLFSGIGGALLIFVLTLIFQRRKKKGQYSNSEQSIGTNIKSTEGKVTINNNTISGEANKQSIGKDIDAGKGEVEISGNRIQKGEDSSE